ncbi:MAG: hydrogenase maturation nickel metallochaperone HypA [Tissierellia bacterium]|nr:hydrogenase maturation nickel metallochaperone HypA [Tissierellia bacterium]
MHELGIMISVVETVEKFAKENGITEIETLVIQIGEISSVVPHFAQACYPAAIDGTMMENTELKIEIIPANCRCNNCSKIFGYVGSRGICPHCEAEDWELLGGEEFNIKEIVAC